MPFAMRIALISTLATPVRQIGAGSIESLVWLLSRELSDLGHQVTVFGTAGSRASGEVVTTLPGTYGEKGAPDDWQLCELINLTRAIEESGRFDVLHSHAYLWGLPLERFSTAPMVHTLHVSPDADAVRLRSMYPGGRVVGISETQWSNFAGLRPAATIHHGVDDSQFTFQPNTGDYLCYLGRFTPGKGPLEAISAARSLGLPLRLAGPRSEYFSRHVEPELEPGRIDYVGPIGGAERDRLLGGAVALLYPIQEPEPFGLVMVEAMMCGTPVAAFRVGAVSEIIDEGVSGFSVPSGAPLETAVAAAVRLDRRGVRARAKSRFSGREMAVRHLKLYEAAVTHG